METDVFINSNKHFSIGKRYFGIYIFLIKPAAPIIELIEPLVEAAYIVKRI